MALCRVCSHEFEQDSILCAQCETPHHHDCFQYNRGCSIYACGSQLYKIAKYNPQGKFIGLEKKDLKTQSLTDILVQTEIFPRDYATLLLTSFLKGYNIYRIIHQQPHVTAVDSATETLNITDQWTKAICRWAAVEWAKNINEDSFRDNEKRRIFMTVVIKYAKDLQKHLGDESA